MNARTLALLSAALCIAIGAGIVLFEQVTRAETLRPGAPPAADDRPVVEAPPAVHRDDLAPAVSDGVFHPGDGTDAISPTFKRREETSGWTSGVIRGDIKLAVSALDKLSSITVVVEHRGPGPNKRILQKVERGQGTPTFEVRDVPFSEHPYVVMVHAPGLNGGQRTVVIDEQHPLVDDVVLTITSGAPFSVLLRDQDQKAHTGVTVDMMPVDEPYGRTRHQGITDNFGSVVFDDVLEGPYELRTSLDGLPFGDTERVDVMPGKLLFSRKIQGQGHVMTIPRGVAVEFLVHDGAGYGVPDAEVKVTKTDRRTLLEIPKATDAIGRAAFPHLQPGTWQVTIEHGMFGRKDFTLTLNADQEPVRRNIELKRSRW